MQHKCPSEKDAQKLALILKLLITLPTHSNIRYDFIVCVCVEWLCLCVCVCGMCAYILTAIYLSNQALRDVRLQLPRWFFFLHTSQGKILL